VCRSSSFQLQNKECLYTKASWHRYLTAFHCGSGICILGANPLHHGYFYFWNHKNSTTGASKWLIKFVFAYAISELDEWLFNDRNWDGELKMPKGNSSILFDQDEVSDVQSITENALKDMILWDPNYRAIAEDPSCLVLQRETLAILEHLFHSLPCWEGSQNDVNRICYFEKASNSDIYLKMRGQKILLLVHENAIRRFAKNIISKKSFKRKFL
jgi:hypothetical protein